MARTTKDQNGGTPPTMEDVQAIGTAAATAAETESQAGGDPEAAGTAAATAAQAEAEARGIKLPPEVIDQIAKASAAATVAELSRQGAVMPPAPEQKNDDDDQEQDADEGDTHTPPQAPGVPPPTAEGPKARTFAERVLGGYDRRR